MSRTQNKANKLAVLQVIKGKKDSLFGSFQNNATCKTQKQDGWTEVLKTAQSLGLAAANREWTYARDNLFGLWKSRTLAKKDNAKRTGTAGGKNVLLDEVDNYIRDILGNESTVVQGLGQPESDGVSSNLDNILEQSQPERTRPTNRKRTYNLQDRHEELKLELLETEIYKNKLKILSLEQKLGLKRSKFTADLEKESMN
ncbi:uncharacterized protein LOC125779494 [Bactrocera dorsalis]|uniref:Uncharacterized protein LOC125779494 n=1 Tax=Bactrocera dorsalis TaxID=27457 RepID=A0ABM3K5R5_BACDO|nr:uncharacterized protein LOC125779494 [Bactrocera dorsalis]